MGTSAITLLSGLLGLFVGSLISHISYRLPLILNDQWRSSCYQFIAENSNFHNIHLGYINNQTPSSVSLFSRSYCLRCKQSFTWLSIFPVFPWLCSQGKCSYCQTATSPLRAYIELLTGFIFMVIVSSRGYSTSTLIILSLTALLFIASLIDSQHQILPDSLTYPLLWSGLISGYFELTPLTLPDSLLGIITGFLLLWLPANIFKLITGIHGLGYGDIKLISGIGAWLGPPLLPTVILFASLSGVIFWLFQSYIKKQKNVRMAFGPFIAVAGWLALLEDPFIINLSLL